MEGCCAPLPDWPPDVSRDTEESFSSSSRRGLRGVSESKDVREVERESGRHNERRLLLDDGGGVALGLGGSTRECGEPS